MRLSLSALALVCFLSAACGKATEFGQSVVIPTAGPTLGASQPFGITGPATGQTGEFSVFCSTSAANGLQCRESL